MLSVELSGDATADAIALADQMVAKVRAAYVRAMNSMGYSSQKALEDGAKNGGIAATLLADGVNLEKWATVKREWAFQGKTGNTGKPYSFGDWLYDGEWHAKNVAETAKISYDSSTMKLLIDQGKEMVVNPFKAAEELANRNMGKLYKLGAIVGAAGLGLVLLYFWSKKPTVINVGSRRQ